MLWQLYEKLKVNVCLYWGQTENLLSMAAGLSLSGTWKKFLQIRGRAGRQRMFSKKIPSTFLSDESSIKVKMKVFRSTYIPVLACGSRERSWLVLDLDTK